MLFQAGVLHALTATGRVSVLDVNYNKTCCKMILYINITDRFIHHLKDLPLVYNKSSSNECSVLANAVVTMVIFESFLTWLFAKTEINT